MENPAVLNEIGDYMGGGNNSIGGLWGGGNMERLTNSGTKEAKPDVTIREIINRLAEYEDLEERLNLVYGQCDGLLEKMVEHLEHHEGIDLPAPIFKARLLTDGEVDKWELYKKIGTVEEFLEAMEKQRAKKTGEPYVNGYGNKKAECLNCHCTVLYPANYCKFCGQKLDWGETV